MKSKKMLTNVKQDALKSCSYYANWDILMTWFASDPSKVDIVGNDYLNKRKEFDKYYLPNVFLSGGKNEGKLSLLKDKLIPGQTTIYACQNNACKIPVIALKTAVGQILK